jgi:hypothetical protein
MLHMHIFHTSTIRHNLRVHKLNGTRGLHVPSLCVHYVIITKCEKLNVWLWSESQWQNFHTKSWENGQLVQTLKRAQQSQGTDSQVN